MLTLKLLLYVPDILGVHLHSDFEISSLKNLVQQTGLFVYFKLDFTACVACKNLVRNRKKIQFVELDFSN